MAKIKTQQRPSSDNAGSEIWVRYKCHRSYIGAIEEIFNCRILDIVVAWETLDMQSEKLSEDTLTEINKFLWQAPQNKNDTGTKLHIKGTPESISQH